MPLGHLFWLFLAWSITYYELEKNLTANMKDVPIIPGIGDVRLENKRLASYSELANFCDI